jgi:hypothetical protein
MIVWRPKPRPALYLNQGRRNQGRRNAQEQGLNTYHQPDQTKQNNMQTTAVLSRAHMHVKEEHVLRVADHMYCKHNATKEEHVPRAVQPACQL